MEQIRHRNAAIQHIINIQLTDQRQHLPQKRKHKHNLDNKEKQTKIDRLELTPPKLVHLRLQRLSAGVFQHNNNEHIVKDNR